MTDPADVSPERVERPKVPCPQCQRQTRVYESVGAHRRRRCLTCGFRFRTREIVVLEQPVVPKPKRSRPKASQHLSALLEAQGGKCVYCGTESAPFEVDHVVPIARGGSNKRSNLVAACRLCNRNKRTKSARAFVLEQWLEAGKNATIN